METQKLKTTYPLQFSVQNFFLFLWISTRSMH